MNEPTKVLDHLNHCVGEFSPKFLQKFLRIRRSLLEQGHIEPTGVHSKLSYLYLTDGDVLEPVHRLCAEQDMVLITLKCEAREVTPLHKVSSDAPSKASSDAPSKPIIIPGTALVDITLMLADAESGEYILFSGSGFQEDASADKSLSKAQGNGLKHCVKALFLLVTKEKPKPNPDNGSSGQNQQRPQTNSQQPRTNSQQPQKREADPTTPTTNGKTTAPQTETPDPLAWLHGVMNKTGLQDKPRVAAICKKVCGGKIPSALTEEADKKKLRDALFVHWAIDTYPAKFGDFDDAQESYRQLVATLSGANTATIFDAWKKTIAQIKDLVTA